LEVSGQSPKGSKALAKPIMARSARRKNGLTFPNYQIFAAEQESILKSLELTTGFESSPKPPNAVTR
jgi:hypothetical protein